MNHLDLPFGRCLCDRFSRNVLLVSSKTTQNDWRRTKRRSDPRRSAIERINRIVKERTPFKPMKEQLRQLPWKLIFILALIQLTRPILSTAGFFDNFRPQGPIIATALIALIWVGVAVIGNVREPVKVLAMAGATYAVIGVALAVFLQTFFTWSPQETASIPLLLTAGLIGGIVVNVIWGSLLGLVATGITKAVKR
jgi:drug/metabolite transporter (DMT)-like permease